MKRKTGLSASTHVMKSGTAGRDAQESAHDVHRHVGERNHEITTASLAQRLDLLGHTGGSN
jgi:hypothetical protein